MGYCKKCNGADATHQPKMPSKRIEIVDGKEKIICDGFVPNIPDLTIDPEPKLNPTLVHH